MIVRHPMSSPNLYSFLLAILACAGLTAARAVTIDGIAPARDLLGDGDAASGGVHVTVDAGDPAEMSLSIVAEQHADVPRGAGGGTVATAPLHQEKLRGDGSREIAFKCDVAQIVFGSVRFQAKVTGPAGEELAMAWSRPVEIGVRRSHSLAGAWAVASSEFMPFAAEQYKSLKSLGASVELPGAISDQRSFRGWVNVTQSATLRRAGDWSYRYLRMEGVADGVLATVNGVALPELGAVERLDSLSHWPEFHSKFKGPEQRQAVMMTSFGRVLPPATLPLAKALPAGPAELALRVRCTSERQSHGIFGALRLEATGPVHIGQVEFETEKPGADRRFLFAVQVHNDTGRVFEGRLRTVYGQYQGATPYTGDCPAYAEATQELRLEPGVQTVRVVREEHPRFATCRAAFVIMDRQQKVLDAQTQDFHTVTMEVRDRRDLYLNNERFIVKAQGSEASDPNGAANLHAMGGNAYRGNSPSPSRRYPGTLSWTDLADQRMGAGLLTAGGPLLASCEPCLFWNPEDTSNIQRAVELEIGSRVQCPGIILWEATNELHGDRPEARVAIQEAIHRIDPYHRPMFATKATGEWEAESVEGRVAGVDIVGCQYMQTHEALDAVLAAARDQPVMITEVNWNDAAFHNGERLWQGFLNKGLCGALWFDYSGRMLNQPFVAIPPQRMTTRESSDTILVDHRELYQDLTARAERLPDQRLRIKLGNVMPYTLHSVKVSIENAGTFALPDLPPGTQASIVLESPEQIPVQEGRIAVKADFITHSGLPHHEILVPSIVNTPTPAGKAAR
jgi:hypothetical protein